MKLGFCIFLLHEKCIFAKIKLFSMLRINSRNKTLIFDRPAIMGILNVTPDSFSDGGRYNQMDKALQHCEQLIADGADFIDIGGCSTRPNNAIATEQEELERVIPILKAIRTAFPEVLISIDTFRKNVAEACVAEGADLINDISGGLFDAEMLPYIGKNHIPYVMMHCVGTPETMHQYTLGGDIHQTVMDFFKQQCTILEAYGEQQIILDPGIGFGKSLEANYQLLGDLERYRYNGLPVLIGISRKSLIFKVLGTTPQDAENGTTVLNTIALLNGADILRVHDVKNAREAIELVGTFCNFAPKFNL
jgi:dihydropteroate synthase